MNQKNLEDKQNPKLTLETIMVTEKNSVTDSKNISYHANLNYNINYTIIGEELVF